MAEEAAGWVRQGESGTGAGFRVMGWITLNTPEPLSRAVIWLLAAGFAAWPGRPENAASRRYLSRILGRPARFADLHRHAFLFGLMLRDRARLLTGGGAGFTLAATGAQAVHEALAAGRGGVLLGAHFGSFEALRAYDRMLPGLTVRYMMYDGAAAASTRVYGALNPEVAARVIPLGQGPQAMLAAAEALERAEFVAFLGDRLPGRESRSQARIGFLGGHVRVPLSPYLAAMAAGVPLILCAAPRVGRDSYAIEFHLLHDGRPVPRAERRAEAARLAAAYLGHLEDLCRRHPYNWFNFFDVWGE
ncbi:acyltransferase [Paralimibaculum aggregatum]|uniref:Acyltransferase n=1 Tax=Paralimibaculum aggregatum TaxID=3036245 RepID=A0ABQ6LSE4_9RHOB|nr:hypothetical protein [Limibaculum sp. NKW23]GMG85004.1 acyltransferase [Limibaculum sp. NKW23]